jgi:hypothetical protein
VTKIVLLAAATNYKVIVAKPKPYPISGVNYVQFQLRLSRLAEVSASEGTLRKMSCSVEDNASE